MRECVKLAMGGGREVWRHKEGDTAGKAHDAAGIKRKQAQKNTHSRPLSDATARRAMLPSENMAKPSACAGEMERECVCVSVRWVRRGERLTAGSVLLWAGGTH